MEFGVAIFPTAYAIPPVELGVALEERGFESVWVAEHTHIPASRISPSPAGGELPQRYYDSFDPFLALTAMASVSKNLLVGTGVCLVIERDPIVTAKEVATLDVMSGGRFLFGVGGGWNIEEMENHGTDPSTRFKRMRESVEAMRAIWADDPAEYHGDLIDFDPIHLNPKPTSAPPVHIGGGSPHGARRAAAYGNGWIPIGGRGGDPLDHVATLREECEKVGRDPSEIELTSYFGPTDPTEIERLADGGYDRIVFGLPSAPAEKILPILDDLATKF
jgi:probable F420-dependent oxidoreductase